MIRRFAVMILGFTVGVLSMKAQDLVTRNLILINGTTTSTILAPTGAGPFTYNLPQSNGTVLMSTDPSLGTAGMMYSVSGPQDTATQGRWLFNVRYSPAPALAGATAAGGGNILSSAYLDANATGLTVGAVAGATSIARGIVANASGGATNYGIDIQSGSLKIGSLNGILVATSGVVSTMASLPPSVTIPPAQVTGITQYALPVGGAIGLTSLSTGTVGFVLVSGGAAANPDWQSVATLLGANVVVYGSTTPQAALVADGTKYLFNVNYNGSATGMALGAVISSDATGGTNASATGLTLIATGTGTSTATALSLAATGSSTKYALTVAGGSGYSGFGTTAPTHVVHSLNTATTDELSAVYGLADGSTSNQAMGVWGDASNNAAANTGSVGVLATGSGRTTTAQTNAAIQIADGEIRVGRTTETGFGYTVVEGATAGTDYTAEGPSGVIEIDLGTIGFGVISQDRPQFATITLNNRYITTNSIVLLTVVDKVDVNVASTVNVNEAIFSLDVDGRAAGSCSVQIAAQLRSFAAGNNQPFNVGDKIRIGYMIVNPSR